MNNNDDIEKNGDEDFIPDDEFTANIDTTRYLYYDSSAEPGFFYTTTTMDHPAETYDSKIRVDFFPPKKKNRTFGTSPLEFPRGCVIIKDDVEVKFYDKDTVCDFFTDLKTKATLGIEEVEEIKCRTKYKFKNCPIGRADGYTIIDGKRAYLTVNVIWVSPTKRLYYKARGKEFITFMPEFIMV